MHQVTHLLLLHMEVALRNPCSPTPRRRPCGSSVTVTVTVTVTVAREGVGCPFGGRRCWPRTQVEEGSHRALSAQLSGVQMFEWRQEASGRRSLPDTWRLQATGRQVWGRTCHGLDGIGALVEPAPRGERDAERVGAHPHTTQGRVGWRLGAPSRGLHTTPGAAPNAPVCTCPCHRLCTHVPVTCPSNV